MPLMDNPSLNLQQMYSQQYEPLEVQNLAENDANFGKVNNALKVLKQSSEFMLDKNPCHFKTPHAAFNISGIAAPSGSNVALN